MLHAASAANRDIDGTYTKRRRGLNVADIDLVAWTKVSSKYRLPRFCFSGEVVASGAGRDGCEQPRPRPAGDRVRGICRHVSASRGASASCEMS